MPPPPNSFGNSLFSVGGHKVHEEGRINHFFSSFLTTLKGPIRLTNKVLPLRFSLDKETKWKVTRKASYCVLDRKLRECTCFIALPLLVRANYWRFITHRLYRGSNLSCLLRLLSLVGFPVLKNAGANSTSHLGSTVVTSLMYSFVVSTSSWYTTHSGCRLKSALDGWMYTTWLSVTVR